MKKTARQRSTSQKGPEIAPEGLSRTVLRAFSLKAGLEILGDMLESEREAVHGLRYRYNEGRKVYRLVEGATENAAACLALLASLRERGLWAKRSLLVVTVGS